MKQTSNRPLTENQQALLDKIDHYNMTVVYGRPGSFSPDRVNASRVHLDGRVFHGLISHGYFVKLEKVTPHVQYGIAYPDIYYRTNKVKEEAVEEIVVSAKASQSRLADMASDNCPSFTQAEPDDLDDPGEMPIDTYVHNQSETYGTDEYWEKLRKMEGGR